MKDTHVEMLLEDINKKFDTFQEGQRDIQIIKNKTAGVEEKLEHIEDDLQIIKTSLKRKVDVEEFETLGKRVVVL